MVSDLDLLVERAALMLAGVWFASRREQRPQPRLQYTKAGEIITAPDYTPDRQAIILDCFKQATTEISAEDFRRRVTDSAVNRTLSVDDEGMKIMAERHELEAVLIGILGE